MVKTMVYSFCNSIDSKWFVLLGSIFMKESPRWLMQVGRDDEAIKNLTWFRQLPEDDEYIIYEVNQVKQSIEEQNKKSDWESWIHSTKFFQQQTCLASFIDNHDHLRCL